MDWFLYDRDLCHERVKVSLQRSGSPQPNELTFNITISWHLFADVRHAYAKFSSIFLPKTQNQLKYLLSISLSLSLSLSCDYLCKTSIKINVATDKGNSRNEICR